MKINLKDLGGQGFSFEFLCLCFGLGPAPKIFTKLLKIVFENEGYFNFSVAKFGVCRKYEKFNSSTSKTNRVLGLLDKYRGNDIISFRKETDTYNSTMSGGLLSTKNFSI